MKTTAEARDRILEARTIARNSAQTFGPRSAYARLRLDDLNKALREGAEAGLPEYRSGAPVIEFDDRGALVTASADYRQPEGDELEDALSPTLDELAADGGAR